MFFWGKEDIAALTPISAEEEEEKEEEEEDTFFRWSRERRKCRPGEMYVLCYSSVSSFSASSAIKKLCRCGPKAINEISLRSWPHLRRKRRSQANPTSRRGEKPKKIRFGKFHLFFASDFGSVRKGKMVSKVR